MEPLQSQPEPASHQLASQPPIPLRQKQMPSHRVYYATFVALIGLLAITAWAAYLPLGPFGTPLALGIAVAKALLILIYFMNLHSGERIHRLVAGAAFVWLSILFILCLSDYLTRGYLHILGK